MLLARNCKVKTGRTGFKMAISHFMRLLGFALFLTTCQMCVSATTADKDLTYTSSEKVALEKLKERVLQILPFEYMKSDFYLIRWLRVKDLNVGQAENMLLQHLVWRKQNKMDTIQKEDWTDMGGGGSKRPFDSSGLGFGTTKLESKRYLETDFPYTMDTHALDDKPIGTIDIYEWDLRRAILQGKNHRLLRYLYLLLEDITGQIFEAQENGKNVTRILILGNAEGFNIIQHACSMCLPSWVQFVQTFEAHYPLFLDELIVIQAPSTVNVVLDLIRPLLSSDTRKALRIFGNNRGKWMTYLDGKVGRDQRRRAYGGTKPE